MESSKRPGRERCCRIRPQPVQMQDEHMEEIWKIFDDRIRAIIPLFETEVKGAKMLNRTIGHLFAP